MEDIKTLSVCCPKCGGEIQSRDAQWKCVRCSFWISAFDGIGQRRSISELEKRALEAGGRRRSTTPTNEAPSVILDSFLDSPQKPPPLPGRTQNSASAQHQKGTPNQPVPTAAKNHPNYVEGNGSREFPFVIHTSNAIRSAQVQREIIDGVFGEGTYQTFGTRLYSESRRGIPGNGDLCEHRVLVNGVERSIWFDLYLVTQLMNDPELNRAKADMMAELSKNPEFVRLQNEMRQKLGLPTQQKPKGCLGVFALFSCAFILIWILVYLV